MRNIGLVFFLCNVSNFDIKVILPSQSFPLLFSRRDFLDSIFIFLYKFGKILQWSHMGLEISFLGFSMNEFNLIVIALLKLLFYIRWVATDSAFLGIGPFYQKLKFMSIKWFLVITYDHFWCPGFLVISPTSFLMLVISVPSLFFFFWSVFEVCQFYWFFSKYELFVLLFFVAFWFSVIEFFTYLYYYYLTACLVFIELYNYLKYSLYIYLEPSSCSIFHFNFK